MSLKDIQLSYSPLTKKIYLTRVSKEGRRVLEKRDAEEDVMCVLTLFMQDISSNKSKERGVSAKEDTKRDSAEMEYSFGEKNYFLSWSSLD